MPQVELQCKQCRNQYMVYPYRLKENSRFCSRQCAGIAKRGIRCSPNTEIKKGQRFSPKTEFKKGHISFVDEEHPFWKGEKASYSSKHKWIYRKWGKAYKCENIKGIKCKKISQCYEWANVSSLYERKREDWLMLCRSCHSMFDHKKKINES